MKKLQWYCSNIYAHSGYSDEARVFVDGLLNAGVPVTIIGKNKKPESKFYQFQREINPGIPVVFHTFLHGNYDIYESQYAVTRTMLEVSRIPQSWVYKFNQMNEIWVPNSFNYDTFFNSGVKKEKLVILPSPVDFSYSTDKTIFNIHTNKKFKFLSLFNHEVRDRKGLDILLKAYIETFSSEDDVCLVIKTKVSLKSLIKEYKLPRNIPEIKIVNEILDKKELLGLYRAVDCFVMPSRGEGIGRPFLDAMMVGIPVISTGWSGHTDFLNEKNSFLVNYKRVDVEKRFYLKYPGFYGSKWAEPDTEDLKKKMKDVHTNYKLALKKAEQANKDIRRFDIKTITSLIVQQLKNLKKRDPLKYSKPNLFERLFPLYYPDVNNTDVSKRNMEDFNKKIESVAIIGSGFTYERAFHFVSNNVGIKKLCYLENQTASEKFLRFPFGGGVGLDQITGSADLVIIAENIKNVDQTFHRIIKTIHSVPIYVFY